MARKRGSSIHESLEELALLEKRYRGKPQWARVQVLQLLAAEPELSIEEAAARVGYSMQSVKRWLKIYREEGVDALLAMRAVPGSGQEEGDLALLKRKLLAGEFKSVEEVLEWGMREGEVHGTMRAKSSVTTHSFAARDEISERVLKFLSSLPISYSIHEWIRTFRTVLQEFLGDVDRISLSVNAVCDLVNPTALPFDLSIAQSVQNDSKSVDPVSIDVDQ